MRGKAARQVEMLTTVTPDALVPQDHPIRRIKPLVDKALAQLSPTFDRMYAQNGRASIPPDGMPWCHQGIWGKSRQRGSLSRCFASHRQPHRRGRLP